MSVAKFTKVESLFRTTLAAGITSTQTTIIFNDAPGALTEFPQWFVIEPLSSNYEIIYVPSDSGSATQSSVVRGINPNSDADTGDAAYQKAHAANVDVILAPLHRHWNEVVDVMDGTDGTGAAIFRIGLDTDVNITIYANNADANKPYIQYNASSNKWLISNDGTSTYDIAAGGSGVIRGPGVDIVGSAITLDVRTSGGLRNNQGTGSVQCDVDPAVVARLDTANTFTAVQSLTADRLQVTTAADSDNDAMSRVASRTDLNTFGYNGTSGAAISVRDAVYVKASDGLLYSCDADADESTYSFIGFAENAATGAAETVRVSRVGGVLGGFSGLTPGSYYFLSGTTGAIAVTPHATRPAMVAQALTATTIRIIEPRFVRFGSQSITSATTFVQTCGFYPTKIELRAAVPGGASGASIGDATNSCIALRLVGANNDAQVRANGWYVYDINVASLESAGDVSAFSQTGFTLNCTTYATTVTVQWVASN